MDADRPGEFELIRRFFAPLAKDPGSLGLTDDAAVLTPRQGYDLVLTKDVLAADIHFFAEDARRGPARAAI
jgi:thiamine-monophosphate kinase